MKKCLIAFFLSTITISCTTKLNNNLPTGVNLLSIDTNVRPQDDLYRHANGAWLKSFSIPADKSNYGSFTKLAVKANNDIKKIILNTLDGNIQHSEASKKVSALYRSFINTNLINELDSKPLTDELKLIDNITTLKELSKYYARAQMISNAPTSVFVYKDPKNPARYITQMNQSGLGLPNREYYLSNKINYSLARAKYQQHIQNMLNLAGITNASEKASRVVEFETLLANKQVPKRIANNQLSRYNKLSYSDIKSLLPNFDWDTWKKAAFLNSMEEAIISQPEYFVTIDKLLLSQPIEDWRTYFKWHLINSSAPYLSEPFSDENFNFFSSYLSGKLGQKSRQNQGVDLVNATLGHAVGKLYIQKHFSPDSKSQVSLMAENIKAAYVNRIKQNTWLRQGAKNFAIKKINEIDIKIGHTTNWENYSELVIKPEDLYGNMTRSKIFSSKKNRLQLNKPIDKSQWFLNPHTVNAYYNPVMNEVVVTAAMLQPPFFSPSSDDSMNYGGIGAVIANQISYAIDDLGVQFNAKGVLQNGWSDQDRDEFNRRAEKLITQYNNYTVLNGLHLNGKFTFGANLADLSGLTVAYQAYRLANPASNNLRIDSYTGSQRFFISWAQIWARKYRDAELRKRLKTDSHSPAEFRANGTVINMVEFHEAFNVKPTDKMYKPPEDRVKIW